MTEVWLTCVVTQTLADSAKHGGRTVRRRSSSHLAAWPAWPGRLVVQAAGLGRPRFDPRPDLTYDTFCVFVAVAPSRCRKPLPVLDFTDRAQELLESMLPGVFPDGPEYADPQLVRYGAWSVDALIGGLALMDKPCQWVVATALAGPR